MKLEIELIPQSTWYVNVRSMVSAEQWKACQRRTFRAAHNRCEICGGRGPKWPVECHEIWRFEPQSCTQRLTGLIALCPDCHLAKHYGFAVSQGKGEDVIRTLMRVNQQSREQSISQIEAALRLWKERSQHQWNVNIDWLWQNLSK